MGILATNSNPQNCIKNKIPEYARDYKNEYLFVRGINKELFIFLEIKVNYPGTEFVSSSSNIIKSYIKRFLKSIKNGYLDTSNIVFKYYDVKEIVYEYNQSKCNDYNEDDFPGYQDFYNLIRKIYKKINFIHDDDDDKLYRPIEYLSDPVLNISDSESDSDENNIDDFIELLENIYSDSDSD